MPMPGELPFAAPVSETPAYCSDLPYLEAVILETMRVLPPAYMVGRCAKEDVTLGDWHIPKGTTMLVGCVVMHRFVPLWPSTPPAPQIRCRGPQDLSFPFACRTSSANAIPVPSTLLPARRTARRLSLWFYAAAHRRRFP